MFDFSALLLVRWLILFGIPWLISFELYLLLTPILVWWLAIPLMLISIILSINLLRKLIPDESIKNIFYQNLTKNLGRLRSTSIIIACFIVGYFAVQQCYDFTISNYKSLYDSSDTLELKVTTKGIIHHTQSLTAQLFRVGSENLPVDSLKFTEYDKGKYIAWRDLKDLDSGVYRVKCFFSNYESANAINKLKLTILDNNHLQKQFVFRIKPDSNKSHNNGRQDKSR
jgi:hypothetical protein